MKHLIRMLIALCFLAGPPAFAQSAVTVEAESGVIGEEFTTLSDGDIDYITINSTIGGGNPNVVGRTASYEVTFPAAGTYNLYARIFVGNEAFNDDSFYYANGFGAKDPASDADWILANGLAAAGYGSTSTDPVMGMGNVANNQWKWLQLSIFDGGEGPVSFTVDEASLTQTFQIAGREDGLRIDKVAFGPDGVYYFAAELDAGLPGTAPAPPPPPPPYTPPGPPMAEGKDKFVGGVYSTAQVPNFTAYWNQVTPENAGKWGSVEGTRDVMNWGELDTAYALAKDNGFPFHFHVLVWGNQQPDWIRSLPPEEQLEEIEEWFAAVAERYPAIDYMEVVNEPLHDPPNQDNVGGGNYYEALGGAGETGWDWILTAFRMAKLYFPDSDLMLNDYSIVNDDNNLQNYLQIIDLLQAEGLIDTIGVQGHAFSTRGSAEAMSLRLDELALTGLPIQVTELDIDGPTDEIQLADYQRIFLVFWEHPAVEGITLWGYRPGHWRSAQGAYIVYEEGGERPAMQWLYAYVSNNPPVVDAGQVFNIDEHPAMGSVPGSLTAMDMDSEDVLTWSIVGGTAASALALDTSTGELSVIDSSVLDFENSPTFTLNVLVNDGYTNSDVATITINLSNTNDNAPVVIADQSFVIDEIWKHYLGSLEASDADDGNDPGFTHLRRWKVVGGDGEGLFWVHPHTGALKLKKARWIDYSQTAYSLEVTVSDGANASEVAVVQIVIPDEVSVCYKRHNKTVPRDWVAHYLRKGADLGTCPVRKPWWCWW